MLDDDEESILVQTTVRNLEPISKAGHKDGAADGQEAAFQESFDEGYLEGFDFGFKLGFYDAKTSNTYFEGKPKETIVNVKDKGKVNCQICIGNTTVEQNVIDLTKVQKAKNIEILSKPEFNE